MMMASKSAKEIQFLVKLNNEKTFVLNFSQLSRSSIPTKDEILHKLSYVTCLPQHILRLQPNNEIIDSTSFSNLSSLPSRCHHVFFLSAYTFHKMRGGKGGFGTLLKGQSKQAGARRTVDFGSCRDLNGRRLRHINDEIKLRMWKESMSRRMNDRNNEVDVEKEIQELRTQSGLRNWHLAVPSWGNGEMSGKSRRREDLILRKEIGSWARAQQAKEREQMAKKRAFQQTIIDYANATQQKTAKNDEKISMSVLEGMKKRRKVMEPVSVPTKEEPKCEVYSEIDGKPFDKCSSLLSTSSICTLSGDFEIDGHHSVEIKCLENENLPKTLMYTRLQSRSQFATAAVLINPSLHDQSKFNGTYYEVMIESAGISQIGWAKISSKSEEENILFSPNCDEGDGVGDDSNSWGFDGSRQLTFYGGSEKSYARNIHPGKWKKGDILGCTHNVKEGSISYSLNGENLNIAFDNLSKYQVLYPAFSLNINEVIGLNIGPSFQFQPYKFQGISNFVDDFDGSLLDSHEVQANGVSKNSFSETIISPPNKGRLLDLDEYNSSEELESLGLLRLKDELYHRGCKCGGSLKERAHRLFAVKGLVKEEIPLKMRGKNFDV